MVDKPGGLAVHRSRESRGDEDFALQRLRDQLGRLVYPVHRLDRATSGALVFALSPEDAAAAQQALGGAGALKEYLALVRGETAARLVSERPLTPRDSDGRAEGPPQPARTDFERVASFSRCSLLEARLESGRRHQVRRHLAHLAHQVIGDTRYGKGRINAFFRESYGLPRMFLHAHRLRFPHPRGGGEVSVLAPLAPDLRAFLGRLPDAPCAALSARWGYAACATG
ncbi:MAG: pseudouridine synthase [Planctomycetota bacterium]